EDKDQDVGRHRPSLRLIRGRSGFDVSPRLAIAQTPRMLGNGEDKRRAVAFIGPVATGNIVRDSERFGGEPILEGTRIPVATVVLTNRCEGSLEAVDRNFP